MGWCTHCRKACKKECINGFIACPTCGKVLGEIRVRRVRSSGKTRMKRVRVKKINPGTMEADFFSDSSSTVTHVIEPLSDGFKRGTDMDQLIEGCTACPQVCRTESSGDFPFSSACEEVLGEVIQEELKNRGKPSPRE